MPSPIAAISAALLLALAPSSHAQDKAVTPEEARVIAKEATIYGFPLVDNYRVMYSYFVDKENKDYKGPWNQIQNEANVFTSNDKAMQTPNSDTSVFTPRDRSPGGAAGHQPAGRSRRSGITRSS